MVQKTFFTVLHLKKAKEMIVDFRKSNFNNEKIYIKGQEEKVVENYKYLGVNINNRLDWHALASTVITKINQRIHFVRKLKFFSKLTKL